MIESNVPADAISANERAVIEKYGFEVSTTTRPGEFRVVDPVVRDANGGKYGAMSGTVMQTLLVEMVKARKTHEEAASKKPGKKAQPKKAVSERVVAVKLPADGVLVNANDEPPLPLDNPPADKPADEPVQKPVAATKSKPVAKTAPVEKPADKPLEKTVAPPAEIADPVIDNTGKREKASKKAKEPKERKDSRYLRASKIIADNLDIVTSAKGRRSTKWLPQQQKLAKLAEMSDSTAGHCIEAWNGVCEVLAAHGWLKLPKV